MSKMKLEDAIAIMRKADIKVPVSLQMKAFDLNMASNGTVQVWMCKDKKCLGWRYNAPIKTLSVGCPKGHEAYVFWDKEKSTLAGT